MERDKQRASDGTHSLSTGTYLPTEQDMELQEDYDEPGLPEGQQDRRGDSLWRVLNERQINMIAFSGAIGNGLFLGSGRSIASAGPGGAVLSYLLIGTVIHSVISCLGEMTALMPVNAPMMEFPRRFLDRGVGFAVGWIYWFAYAVIAANQLVAVTNAIKFRYDDGKTFLNWPTGEQVDNAVWFIALLVLATGFNLLRVKTIGNFEYVFGSIKICFITLLIVMMFVLSVMRPRSDAYYDEPLGTKYWNEPYGFFNPTYRVGGEEPRDISGSVGSLLGVWTTFIHVMFSYVGMDIVAATAAESRALSDPESMKMAARKLNLRVIILYTLAVVTASFVVPYSHPFLNGGGQSVGSRSVFVIAVVEAGLPSFAHFFNAMFVFSSSTVSISSMYVASRVLHTLALRGQTGPEWITSRLRQCHSGVPVRTVFVTAAVMLIGLMGRSGSPGARLQELGNNCTVSFLIVYSTICATYLCFYKAYSFVFPNLSRRKIDHLIGRLKHAKTYSNASEAQAASYDRNHPSYPYKSHAQWLKAAYGMVTCIILILFNGVAIFLEKPFNVRNFISAYISLPVFFLLVVGYKVRNHGFQFSKWGLERSQDIGNTVQVLSQKRAVAGASIQFTIASGPCLQGRGVFNECDNSDIGGMCASAPDANKEWCCEPGVGVCGSWGETCNGAGNLAGPGQILCQSKEFDEQWCCNAEYDTCVDVANAFNLCRTKFANPYADISEEEALSLKSDYFSTAATTSSTSQAQTSSATQPTSTSGSSTTSTSASSGAATSSSDTKIDSPPSSESENNGDEEDKQRSGLETGAIVGIAVGAVVAVAILGLLSFFLIRQRRKGQALRSELDSLTSQWQDPKPVQHQEWSPPVLHEMGNTSRPSELPGQNAVHYQRVQAWDRH
ncbi:Proline-specific permease [Paramyrothecium foliicola]|nr:Proline-specific permease [Paramyrothecium foliicola]